MSSGTAIELTNLPDSSEDGLPTNPNLPECSDDEELDAPLVPGAKNVEEPEEGFLQRLMVSIEEHVNIRELMRRLEFVVRLMLVATFLDDSLRTTMHFPGLTQQIYKQGCLKWLAGPTPGFFVVAVATLTLAVGLLAQLLGSLCLIARFQPDIATKALIAWTIAQPILNLQLSNVEFVSESLSLLGGLLMLRAHLVSDQDRHGLGAHTRLLGRMLLPAAYLYQAGRFFLSAVTLDETTGAGMYLADLSIFVVNALALVGLVIGSALVAAGLKSRTVALVLALVNIGLVFYQHPFFLMLRRGDDGWEVDEKNRLWQYIALPDVSPMDLDLWEVYDLHRYNFFLGLSTSGALMLLAQFGPGEIAAQKDEILLPIVHRAGD